MAEKVKVKSSTIKKQTDSYILYNVELEDGRKGTSFDLLEIGKEIEIEIEAKGQYTNFKLVKEKKGGKFGAPKDWTFEKRKVSLDAAIQAIKLTEQKITSKNIIALSHEFFTYLNLKNESIS